MKKFNSIEELKDNYIWFVHSGTKKEGALLYESDVNGVKPIDSDGAIGFYALDSLIGIDVPDISCTTYYEDDGVEGDTIKCDWIVNQHNKNKFIDVWASVKYINTDECERMLCTETDEHYDWKSDLTKFVGRVLANDKTANRETWEQTCDQYIDDLGVLEIPTWDEVLEIAKKRGLSVE